MEQFVRTELLLGKKAMRKLEQSHVAIFGLGGVGSFAAEAVARSGIGAMTIVDFDNIDISNINRQLPALISTVGHSKAQEMEKRIRDIHPDIRLTVLEEKYLPDDCERFFAERYDFVVDAIDMVASKISLISECKRRNIPIISSMGMGNKIAPEKIKLCKLAKTHTDPLAKVVRKKLRDLGITDLDVVFSEEESKKLGDGVQQTNDGQTAGGITEQRAVKKRRRRNRMDRGLWIRKAGRSYSRARDKKISRQLRFRSIRCRTDDGIIRRAQSDPTSRRMM